MFFLTNEDIGIRGGGNFPKASEGGRSTWVPGPLHFLPGPAIANEDTNIDFLSHLGTATDEILLVNLVSEIPRSPNVNCKYAVWDSLGRGDRVHDRRQQ